MKKVLCSFVATCCLVLVLASFAEVLAAPVADAGPDQIVFDEVTLDGTGSAPAGTIILYEWMLIHNEDPALNRIPLGYGPVVNATDLSPGFYLVVLTVTDGYDGLKDSDVMSLAVAGVYVPAPTPRITAVDPDPPVLGTDQQVFLYGNNFGDYIPEESFVQIGKRALDIDSWGNELIVAYIPSYKCGKFDGAPSRELKIYVKVGDAQSNKRTITVNAPAKCTPAP